VFDGNSALDKILSEKFDLIILDIMLPGMEGFQILKFMREEGIKTPVLILTAKADDEDKVKGLDYGADDYLTKPFSQMELLARTRAILRRTGGEDKNIISAGNLKLDLKSKEIYFSNLKLDLTPK